MKPALLFILLSSLCGSGFAQVSVAVERSDYSSGRSPSYGGPFFLNDSVLVYTHDAGLYSLSTRENSQPVRIQVGNGLGALVQAADGRLYALPGGTCDVVPRLDRVYSIAGSRVDDIQVNELVKLDPDAGAAIAGRERIGVGADQSVWVLAGTSITIADPTSGRLRKFAFPVTGPINYNWDLEVFDSTRAILVSDGTAYYLRATGGTMTSKVLTGKVLDLMTDPATGRVLVLSEQGLSDFEVNGVQVGATKPLPFSRNRVAVLAAPSLVLTQSSVFPQDRLQRWNPVTEDTSSTLYYEDVSGWGLRTARVSSRGDLALRACDQDHIFWTADAPIPEPQSFVQFIPSGTNETLMGPPVTFEVSFRNALNAFREVALAYDVEVTNASDQLIEAATIIGSEHWRCFNYNRASISDLAPSAKAAAKLDNGGFYYNRWGTSPKPGEYLQATFKVMHSNGRPVGSSAGTIRGIRYLVTSIRDIASVPDVTLYPTIAATTVTVEYADPRTELLVIDALGRVAFRQNLDPTQTRVTIDVSGFGESLHYLLLSSQTGTSVHPFTVQR